MKKKIVKQIGPTVSKEDLAITRILVAIDEYSYINRKEILKAIIKIAKTGL